MSTRDDGAAPVAVVIVGAVVLVLVGVLVAVSALLGSDGEEVADDIRVAPPVSQAPAPEISATPTPARNLGDSTRETDEVAATRVAERYISIKNNVDGVSGRGWKAAIRPLVTAEHYSLLSSAGTSAGSAEVQRYASELRLDIKSTVGCTKDDDSPVAAGTLLFNCGYTFATVGPDGEAYDTSTIPILWPYASGAPQDQLLIVNKVGKRWLVDKTL